MSSASELRERRLKTVEEVEKMIRDAESANGGRGRDLTADEERRFEEARKEITSSGKRIEKAEFAEGLSVGKRKTKPDQPTPQDTSLAVRRGRTGSGSVGRVGWSDASGREVRCLSRDEKLSDLATEQYGALPQGLRFGNIMRAVVTGDPTCCEAEMRAMGGVTNTGGGYLVPSMLSSQVLDYARAQTVCFEAGAVTIPIPDGGSFTIARVATPATISVKGENNAFTETEVSFDAITFVPRTIGCVVTASRELAADAQNFANAVEQDTAREIAYAIDRLALIGTGTLAHLNILGLAGSAGNTVTSVGTPTNWNSWMRARRLILEDSHIPNAIILSPRDEETLYILQEATTNQYLQPPFPLRELQQFVTPALPTNEGAGTNESSSYVGQFAHLLFGIRQELLIDTSTEAGEAFERNQVKIRLTMRLDCNVAYRNAFCRLSGILA